MNNLKIFSYQRLEVWQNARKFNKLVFTLSNTFPKEQQFVLKAQILRSSLSVCANIAEGSGRIKGKDQAHFIRIAFSSLVETECHLILASDLNYFSKIKFEEEIKPLIDIIGRQLNALYRYNINSLNSQKKYHPISP
jgi:four helix bundle protein